VRGGQSVRLRRQKPDVRRYVKKFFLSRSIRDWAVAAEGVATFHRPCTRLLRQLLRRLPCWSSRDVSRVQRVDFGKYDIGDFPNTLCNRRVSVLSLVPTAFVFTIHLAVELKDTKYQGELCTSGPGQNRSWLWRGADVCGWRSKDHSGGCTSGIGAPTVVSSTKSIKNCPGKTIGSTRAKDIGGRDSVRRPSLLRLVGEEPRGESQFRSQAPHGTTAPRVTPEPTWLRQETCHVSVIKPS